MLNKPETLEETEKLEENTWKETKKNMQNMGIYLMESKNSCPRFLAKVKQQLRRRQKVNFYDYTDLRTLKDSWTAAADREGLKESTAKVRSSVN
ncbi:hypothetical protein NECAME_15995 [Necator americanus]|uniref:Uncharacterized protein n=1 Tax=Necator americanus TaxID=51031 RepID=W2SF11_NECAM|nr:hypothetical protein NECAME_15995 [Necator americanus]ETN68165.1 hypothetical protein NECAME_15995 [Necator americanus]